MEAQNERSQENIVSSFFYYMWNAWDGRECAMVCGLDCIQIWEKWRNCCTDCPLGATEYFYMGLSNDIKEKLVTRACEVYNGRHRTI